MKSLSTNLLGVIAALVFLHLFYTSYQEIEEIVKTGVITQSKVVAVEAVEKIESTIYMTTFEYTDLKGNRQLFKVRTNPGYKINEQETIIYNPAHPKQAHMYSFSTLYFIPAAFLAMGGAFAIIAGSALWFRRKLYFKTWFS